VSAPATRCSTKLVTRWLCSMMLLGGDSLPFYRVITDQLQVVLPNGRMALLPDQRRSAMMSAP